MIHIVNYGLGNLSSIANIIRKMGGKSCIANHPDEILTAEKIILPGVGAFDHGMQQLMDKGWIPALNHVVLERKIPALGICLGMQLMCKGSEEGVLPGLAWFDADVVKFQIPAGQNIKVPHMGWNTIKIKKNIKLLPLTEQEQRFYFVHSYHVVCNNPEDIWVETSHGYPFTAAIAHNNLMATQFHPEKSHRYGMQLMQHFIEFSC